MAESESTKVPTDWKLLSLNGESCEVVLRTHTNTPAPMQSFTKVLRTSKMEYTDSRRELYSTVENYTKASRERPTVVHGICDNRPVSLAKENLGHAQRAEKPRANARDLRMELEVDSKVGGDATIKV
jgi:hypothetical protein